MPFIIQSSKLPCTLQKHSLLKHCYIYLSNRVSSHYYPTSELRLRYYWDLQRHYERQEEVRAICQLHQERKAFRIRRWGEVGNCS